MFVDPKIAAKVAAKRRAAYGFRADGTSKSAMTENDKRSQQRINAARIARVAK